MSTSDNSASDVFDDKYRTKVLGCRKCFKELDVAEAEVLSHYENDYFPDTGLEKRLVFGNILNCDLPSTAQEYFESKCNLPWHKDKRSAVHYGVDLILGWLIEDAVVSRLSKEGRRTRLTGNDRYREFLHPRKISTQPDLKIQVGSEAKLLDVFCDWSGTWRNKGHADLRDNKFKKLQKHKAILLGIAPLSVESFLIDFAKEDGGFQAVDLIPAWQKPGATTNTIRDRLQPIDKTLARLIEGEF